MRLEFMRQHRTRGNTLMATLCATAIIGVALACYLQLATNQNQLITRSQVWNSCMPVLEAGIEEAMAHMTANYGTNMASNGWLESGPNFSLTNAVDDSYYVARISTNLAYEIVSTGYCPMAGGSGYVSRTVKVTTQNKGMLMGAVVVKQFFNLNGKNVTTDSYDSRDPNKSTTGRYDPAKAGDKGDILCMGGMVDSLKVGNAQVWGHVYTSPAGTVTYGPNGSVGDVAWHKAGNMGIKSGWWQNDLNIQFPDVGAPFASATPPGGGTVNGTNYTYILYSGNYQLASLGGRVLVTGNAVLYVTVDLKFTGSDYIWINPGASLTIYFGGSTALFNDVNNQSLDPNAMLFYGLPPCTSLTIKGTSLGYGIYYAPEADITINGGTTLYGSLVGNSATITGNSSIHYDEAMINRLPSRGFIVTSWNEL